jgi:predicted ATPase
VPSEEGNTKLTWFKNWMRSLWISAVDPEMKDFSSREATEPDPHLADFVSWYRYLARVDPTALREYEDALKAGVVQGFENFTLVKLDENTWRLDVRLKSDTQEGGMPTPSYRSYELSDGQRVLIKLYALAFCAMKPGSTLILDDPVVHVSLREIQPWLTTLLDRSDDIKSQVLIISHHPEIVNYLAGDKGVFFSREDNGPVRVKPLRFDDDPGLTPAEAMARGWIDE